MAANGGLITKEDLAAYEAKERAPVKGTFRGYEIAAMPPPSSGGVALIEMLNMLEAFDLKAKGFDSRRGAASRDRSDAPRLPRSRALPRRSRLRAGAAGEAACRRTTRARWPATIDPAKATQQRRARQGHRHRAAGRSRTRRRISPSSTRTAWPCRNTYTLEGGYGSRVVVKGAGFLLNNEMGDFNKKPGRHATRPATSARRRT